MNARVGRAVAIWRRRKAAEPGGRAYIAYMTVMVALVTVLPVGRAVWLSAASPAGLAMLGSPAASAVVGLIVASVWAGALMWGSERGPALRPPFLTLALAASDIPRSAAFRVPVLRAAVILAVVSASSAGLIGAALLSHGVADLRGVIVFAVSGALVGVMTAAAWLAGQVFPRAAVSGSIVLLVFGGVGALVPAVQAFTPWGWVGLAYPTGESSFAVIALAALAVAAVSAMPPMMNLLRQADLVRQAVRWDSAVVHAVGMDFDSAATVYRSTPTRGRGLRAVRPGRRIWSIFFVRDAIGSVRMPGRLVAGILALSLAGVLLALAAAPSTPGWLLGAVAGVIAFAGLGPLTDGLRHAASVAADYPLFGISDEFLLVLHALYPLTVAIAVLVVAAVITAVIIGTGAGPAVLGALSLGVSALGARVNAAMKGPLPPALLAPMSTPMGDPMAAVRMVWAVDALLLAGLGGAAAAIVFEAPMLTVLVFGVLLVTGLTRWRRRR